MLTIAHRLDLLKLSADLAKAQTSNSQRASKPLATSTIEIFGSLRAILEDGNVLEDTNIGDVKSAMDIASDIEEYLD